MNPGNTEDYLTLRSGQTAGRETGVRSKRDQTFTLSVRRDDSSWSQGSRGPTCEQGSKALSLGISRSPTPKNSSTTVELLSGGVGAHPDSSQSINARETQLLTWAVARAREELASI